MSNSNVQLKKDPRDFVQFTRGYLKASRELAKKSPAAWQVFSLLTERMNKGNAVVVSQATLSEILGYTRSTINTAVKVLEKQNWVQIVKIGQSNAYVVNALVVWRDRGGKRYASFNAEILASETEQDAPLERWDSVELRHVPVLGFNDDPLLTDEELPPPDQIDLLPPDRIEFPRSSTPPVDPEAIKALDREIEAQNAQKLINHKR